MEQLHNKGGRDHIEKGKSGGDMVTAVTSPLMSELQEGGISLRVLVQTGLPWAQ